MNIIFGVHVDELTIRRTLLSSCQSAEDVIRTSCSRLRILPDVRLPKDGFFCGEKKTLEHNDCPDLWIVKNDKAKTNCATI